MSLLVGCGEFCLEVEAESYALRPLIRCLKEQRSCWMIERRWKPHWTLVVDPVSVLGVGQVENRAA
jgi:hypothetical protein